MSFPEQKAIPGITVQKDLQSYNVDVNSGYVTLTYLEGVKSYPCTYQGEWGSGDDYAADDVVLYEGAYYLALQASTHSDPKQPDEEPTYWEAQEIPGDNLNGAGQPFYTDIQRTKTAAWSWPDFVNLVGSSNEGEISEWAFLQGIMKYRGTIFDALAAASQSLLPD